MKKFLQACKNAKESFFWYDMDVIDKRILVRANLNVLILTYKP